MGNPTKPEFEFDRSKFKELMLYIAASSEADSRFGAVKLNKILYYADALHYAEQGKPITGAVYVRRQFGQAPRDLLPIRAELVSEGRAAMRLERYFGQTQKRLVSLVTPDLSAFGATEIELVDEVIGALWEKTAIEVSETSHRLMGWRCARENEEIPYHAIFLIDLPLTEADRQWAREVAERYDLAEATADGS
jgi:hypothetical protein